MAKQNVKQVVEAVVEAIAENVVTPTIEAVAKVETPKLTIRDRMAQAMNMITAGKTTKEIMAELGVSTTYVYKLRAANPSKEAKVKKEKVVKVKAEKPVEVKVKVLKVKAPIEVPAVVNATEENIEAMKDE